MKINKIDNDFSASSQVTAADIALSKQLVSKLFMLLVWLGVQALLMD